MNIQSGSIAQLGEHLPYKQGVTGSSPVTSTINKPVRLAVSTLHGMVLRSKKACPANGGQIKPPHHEAHGVVARRQPEKARAARGAPSMEWSCKARKARPANGGPVRSTRRSTASRKPDLLSSD